MSRLQELCDKYLIGPNVEKFLRNPENREQSSKFFGRILEQCLCWRIGLKNESNDITLKRWLEDDLEIAKEINKILLEVDDKEINEPFNKIVKLCETVLENLD